MSEVETTNTEVASRGEHTQEVNQDQVQQSKAKPDEVVNDEKSEKQSDESVKPDEEKEVEAKSEDKDEKPEEKPVERQKDRFAVKFAALSRKEKALKSKESELESKIKLLQEKEQRFEQYERLKRENPLRFLEENGLTYEEITKAVLNDGELTPEQKQQNVLAQLQDEIKGLKEKLVEYETENKRKEAELTEKKYEEVILNYKNEIYETVSGNEKYELIQANDAYEDVYELIGAYYQTHKRVLDIHEAAEMVESYLEEQAEKLVRTKKLSSKFVSPQKADTTQSKKAQSETPKTLENAHSSTVPDRQARKLSDDELVAEAASLIRWNE